MNWIPCLTASCLALAVCASPAIASKKNNDLRIAFDIAPESIDPFFNSARVGFIIGQHVWDTLIYRDPATGDYKGQLAKSWRWIDDKTLEFDLREGIKFHNGEVFDADDVVYTLNYVSKPETKAVTQSNVSWIAEAIKLEPYKVRIKTKATFPAALEYLSGPVVIHPDQYHAASSPQEVSARPVGTGPYRVVEHIPGKSVKLQKYAGYFADSPKSQPKIERIEIRFIPDRQTQIAELMSGGLDFAMGIPVDEARGLTVAPELQVLEGETMRVVFLNLNSLESGPAPALRDLRVRQAIAHAIDRPTMVHHLVGAKARLINALCFPTQFGCDDSQTVQYGYDPARAKALLAEAGYPQGIELDFAAYRERDQSEAMIGYLRAVGIRVNFRFLQYATLRDQLWAGKIGFAHQTWGSFSINDASACVSNFFTFTPNDINRDPEIRDLLNIADSSIDPATRKTSYAKALGLISQRAYAIPLYSLPTYYVASGGLTFSAYPDEMPRIWEMSWK